MTRVHGEPPSLEPVLHLAELQSLFRAVDAVHLPRAVANFISRLVAATHPKTATAPDAVRNFVKYGSSPRGAIAIGAYLLRNQSPILLDVALAAAAISGYQLGSSGTVTGDEDSLDGVAAQM